MRGRGGFTMVEIIVVVAVIAILAGFLTPTVIKQVAKSKIAKTMGDMDAIVTGFNDYFADTGSWPNYNGTTNVSTTFADFRCMYINQFSLTGWGGPYLNDGINVSGVIWVAQAGTPNRGIIDPWGQLYRLEFAPPGSANGGPRGAIAVISAGPNQVVNTTAANALRGQADVDDIVRLITRVVL